MPDFGTGICRHMASNVKAMRHIRNPLESRLYHELHSSFVSLESFADLLKDKCMGLLGQYL